MKYIKHYWYMVLAFLSLTACSEDKMTTFPDEDKSGVMYLDLRIQTPSQQGGTRTSVTEPEDDKLSAKHHVSCVKLYVVNDDESDANGYQNILFSKEFIWKQYSPDTQQNGYRTDSMTVELNLNDIGSVKKLRVIGVGLDATNVSSLAEPKGNSADAYPDAYKLQVGTKFNNQVDGVYSSDNGTAPLMIPRSELYAGCSHSFSSSEATGIGNKTVLTLHRRVAGIVGYFKNIPDEIKYIGIGSGHKEKSVQMSLPLLSAELLELEDGNQNILDKWTGARDGYIPLVNIGDETYKDDLIFVSLAANAADETPAAVGKVPDQELIEQGEHVRIMGFMPPMTLAVGDYAENASTLMLNLYGDDMNNPIKSVKILLENSVYPVRNTRSGTGIIEDEEERDLKYQYPISANEIYVIGSAENPVSLDGSESYIVIKIDNVWDEYYGGSMTDEAQDGVGMDTEWGDRPAGEINGN